MSHLTNCLNCDEAISKNFCPNCGQKTDTHRITMKHFIFHDILHGVWHFEKGILFTLKETFTRPGRAAIDYISGKRIKYYNVFYLILLLIGLNIFFAHLCDQLDIKYSVNKVQSNTQSIEELKLNEFLADYSKILIFCLIPLFAINSYLLFKRAKYNLSEHFIISGIVILGMMCITYIGQLFYLFDYTENLEIISEIGNVLTPIAILVYIFYCYYDAFKKIYSTKVLVVRNTIFLVITVAEIFITIKILALLLKAIYHR